MTPEAVHYLATDDGEYIFLFTHRALIAAEKSGGMGLGKLMEGLGEGSLGAIAALVHGGLTVHQPQTTLDDALALWESEGPPVVKAMAEALNAAMPIVAKMLGVTLRPPKGAPAAQAAPPGTGSRSSRRGAKKG